MAFPKTLFCGGAVLASAALLAACGTTGPKSLGLGANPATSVCDEFGTPHWRLPQKPTSGSGSHPTARARSAGGPPTRAPAAPSRRRRPAARGAQTVARPRSPSQ